VNTSRQRVTAVRRAWVAVVAGLDGRAELASAVRTANGPVSASIAERRVGVTLRPGGHESPRDAFVSLDDPVVQIHNAVDVDVVRRTFDRLTAWPLRRRQTVIAVVAVGVVGANPGLAPTSRLVAEETLGALEPLRANGSLAHPGPLRRVAMRAGKAEARTLVDAVEVLLGATPRDLAVVDADVVHAAVERACVLVEIALDVELTLGHRRGVQRDGVADGRGILFDVGVDDDSRVHGDGGVSRHDDVTSGDGSVVRATDAAGETEDGAEDDDQDRVLHFCSPPM